MKRGAVFEVGGVQYKMPGLSQWSSPYHTRPKTQKQFEDNRKVGVESAHRAGLIRAIRNGLTCWWLPRRNVFKGRPSPETLAAERPVPRGPRVTFPVGHMDTGPGKTKSTADSPRLRMRHSLVEDTNWNGLWDNAVRTYEDRHEST
tara:strand:+ start:1137 stop:1574 length:438 start_codon:yes stop_codon:yes gene_type:complete